MFSLRYFIVVLVVFSSFLANAIQEPFKWSYELEYLSDQRVKVKATCDLDSGWHVYSIHNPSGGSIPTSFRWKDSTQITTLVPWEEPTPIKKYEPAFEVNQWFHDGSVTFSSVIALRATNKNVPLTLIVENMACLEDGLCTPPVETELEVIISANKIEKEEGLIWVFIFGFGAGFLALLTPCVFPMIPMTVTFFSNQKGKKGIMNAFIYGISIVVIYVALGLGITVVFGDDALYAMASSAIFNIAFFIIFVIFAISFLGAFEITLPQSWVNKADAKADKGGLLGVFFMAFTLSLVSFSCTGPLIGTLIVEAAMGAGVKGPFMGMLGFGLALAIPFAFFALFPNWLSKLPKSGGWLNSVKVVLGFLELALAIKFLSNADLVMQTYWLTREVFIAIWIVLGLMIVFYLLGKLKFSHDSDVPYLSVTRTLFAVFFFSAVVYMVPGMFGAPLKLLSGILPPDYYNEGWSIKGQALTHNQLNDDEHSKQCPNDLACFHDYDEALKVAKQEGKPLMVDFTGYTCVNCRLMEKNVWSVPKIDDLIRNEYILVSLYADNREKLPKEEQYISKRNGKKITTYGEKWRDFQINRYQEISQPLYILLDHNEEMLAPKMSYEKDIDVYYNFLLEGLNAFKAQQ